MCSVGDLSSWCGIGTVFSSNHVISACDSPVVHSNDGTRLRRLKGLKRLWNKWAEVHSTRPVPASAMLGLRQKRVALRSVCVCLSTMGSIERAALAHGTVNHA